MRRIEQGAAVLMMIVALVVAFGTSGLPLWSEFSPGDRFVPLLVASIMLVLAVLYFVEVTRRGSEEAADLPRGADARRVVAVAASIVGFAVLAPLLGFVATTGLFVLVVLVAVLRQRIVPSLLAAAITTAVVQGVFVLWLGIRLPVGVIGL